MQYHNTAWAGEFGEAKANLEKILSGVPILGIEHVGSTAIPGTFISSELERGPSDFRWT